MYVLGGYDGNDMFRFVECYSFIIFEWFQVFFMGMFRFNVGVCVFNSKIYFVGGWDGISLNFVECFDVGICVWQCMFFFLCLIIGVWCCFLFFQFMNE